MKAVIFGIREGSDFHCIIGIKADGGLNIDLSVPDDLQRSAWMEITREEAMELKNLINQIPSPSPRI